MNWHRSLVLWIAVATATVLSGCGENLSAEEYVARAKSYLEKQETERAIIELKNALQSDTNQSEARLLLGKTYLTIGMADSAEKELVRAQNLGAPDSAIQPYLARALLQQNKYEQLLEPIIPTDMPIDVHAEWLSVRGEALLAQGKRKEAEAQFQEALEIQDDSLAAMTGMARLASGRRNFKEARDWLSQTLSANGEYAAGWSLLGAIESYEGNLQAAEDAYTKAIENSANDVSDLIDRSLIRIAQKKYDEAAKDINGLKKRIKDHPLVNYSEGLLFFEQQKYTDALIPLEAALKVNNKFQPALFYTGASHLMLGNLAQAENYLNQYMIRNPLDTRAQKLLALIKLNRGDPAAAERLARTGLSQDPQDSEALNLLANALIRQNKSDESVQHLKKVVAAQPGLATARGQLGTGLVLRGDQKEGISELEKALELDPQLQSAAASLIQAHLRNGELDRALEEALVFRDNNPDMSSAQVLLGIVYFARNEMNDATNAFQKALEIDSDSAAAYNGLAAIAVRSNDLDKAKQYYLDALKNNPDHIKILLNLAEIEARQGNLEGKRYALTQAVEHHPEALEPHIYLGRSYLQYGEGDKAIKVLSEVEAEYPDNPALLGLLVEARLATGQFRKAVSTLQRLDALIPDNAQVHFLYARAYGSLNDKKKMRAELEKAVELSPPNFALARIALARVLIEERQFDAAEIQVKTLKAGPVAKSPDVLVLEGQLREVKGDSQGAIAIYQQAFDAAQDNKTLLRLTSARWAAGDRDRAVSDLKAWAKEHPNDTLTLFTLGNYYLLLEKHEDAVVVFSQVVEQDPKNVVALNNLAWLLRESEPARALKYIEHANSLAPESPEVLDTLAIVLVNNGDIARAERSIDRALAKKPGHPGFIYHRAIILEKAGKYDEAIQELQSILSKDQQFPQREEAASMLKRLRGS